MIKIYNISEELNPKKALIVGVELFKEKNNISIDDSLNELKELANAIGYEVVQIIKQSKSKIESATYLGTGKIQEINLLVDRYDIDIVIFDEELSGIQIRNLEKIVKTDILDRTGLILNIFADRAKSKEGKLQIELAKLKYQLPRLIGWGKMLSRTGAGIGTRGLGESKLELDRRYISKKISDLEKQLKEVKKHREIQRAKRKRNSIPTVALVGYTNSGKSTLLNYFMKLDNNHIERTESFAKDMLFATLDPFHKLIKLEGNLEFLLIDTVGFVSKLPHFLVEAFKSTLEEITEADLLIYVLDISRKDYKHQLKVTKDVIKELNAEDKTYITVYNKIDKLSQDELKKIVIPMENSIEISALRGDGLEELIKKIEINLFEDEKKVDMQIPFIKGSIISYILENSRVISKEYNENGILITTFLNKKDYNKYKKFIIK
ncbi:GTP-binding protein HflX [Hypnocyclicus thermotrophus]|uniref:GTPase HflX n=1 Tax=Hypnocyclicus thermotrophus TaxID=1627895 RepID=A0AA46DZ34_9FUSO|nr:GTPase HflX [Hypnocyclicus thermotrophus]TDT71426.1 GTP-binding protein HflX [Hypnocyclicus thermotrophus]